METKHCIRFEDSRQMGSVDSDSVDLIVTSPPYPMIAMWDDLFCEQNPEIAAVLSAGDGKRAFELMHALLAPVWREAFRVLRPGGFACINMGDATRTVNGNFQVYSNHSLILEKFRDLGFSALPDILWRKQTSAPNKFMGSGMLPAGAYVTLEHEYILVFRKGRKREFKSDAEKRGRGESAFFWEERNLWFSDVWMDVKGTGQELQEKTARKRSAAFPFEIAYRLINMYSVKGDTVLDPFLGTGTTTAAALLSGRNSVGYEIDETLGDTIHGVIRDVVFFGREYLRDRLDRHLRFVAKRIESHGGKAFKYVSTRYGFPVMTRQEREILLNELLDVERTGEYILTAAYSEDPPSRCGGEWEVERENDPAAKRPPKPRLAGGRRGKGHADRCKGGQKELF